MVSGSCPSPAARPGALTSVRTFRLFCPRFYVFIPFVACSGEAELAQRGAASTLPLHTRFSLSWKPSLRGPKGPSVVWPRQQTGRTWVPSRHSFTALGSRRIARGKHQICGLRRSARQQEAGSPVLPHTGAWRTSAAPQTSSCSAQTRTVGGLHVTSSLCCYTVFFFQVINKNDYICKKKKKREKMLFFFTLGWK